MSAGNEREFIDHLQGKEEGSVKLKAYDKVREQFIPQSDFAVTGDGHILIASDEFKPLLYPPTVPYDTVYRPNSDVPDSSVEITVETEKE